MNGFDSEANRRDAIRQQIVSACLDHIYLTIRSNAVTGTSEERNWLLMTVVRKLLTSIHLETQARMFAQEIEAAEKEIDK